MIFIGSVFSGQPALYGVHAHLRVDGLTALQGNGGRRQAGISAMLQVHPFHVRPGEGRHEGVAASGGVDHGAGDAGQMQAPVLIGREHAAGSQRDEDLLQPGFEKAKAEIGDLAKSDEDVLSYVAFPQIAEKFLKHRAEKEKNTVHYTIEEA